MPAPEALKWRNFKRMAVKTALITGGAGFLGAHLCRRLIAEGMRVICVDSLVTGSLENLKDLRSAKKFSFLRADVNFKFKVTGKVDYFFHLASPASPRDYQRMQVFTLRTGSIGTLNCLELAENKKARFLLASTSEIYGDPLLSPQREDYTGNVNPIGPRSCYDEAKRFSEAATAAYSRCLKLNCCIARIFNTYGEGMRPSDGRVISNMACQALAGKSLTVYGTGRQTRSFCYVSDMVEGLVRLCFSEVNVPVNLGNPEEITILSLARMINAITGNSGGIIHKEVAMDDPKRRKPDISRARRLLGWRPRVNLVSGFKKTISWFASRAA
jgi:dTDP-glucose 4,6-dehydratase